MLLRSDGRKNASIAGYLLSAAAIALWVVVATGLAQTPAASSLSTAEEIGADFSNVPCKNTERLQAVRALMKKMQAGDTDISIQTNDGTDNLVVRKQGRSEETIVIGAHYDFVDKGCGAVDNWSGVVAVAHLYRAIRQLDSQKTVLFVAFGNEERGLLGSSAMANAIPDNERVRYCAMINMDSLGLASPFVLEHTSSKKLMQLATEAAGLLKLPFQRVTIGGTDADSSSFLRRDIPAVTLIGLSNDWSNVLHTSRDQAAKVLPENVYLGYRLALVMWSRVDQAPCAAYR